MEKEKAKQQKAIDKLEEESKETENAFSQEDFGEQNPLGNVESCKATGILSLIMGTDTISGKTVKQELLASKRELLTGSGKKETDSFFGAVEDRVLFGEYVMEKFHHALSEEKSEGLAYEVEYVLIGKNSDKENLEGVLNRLLLLREGVNYLYLHSDAEKMAEADTLATALVGFTGLPPVVIAMRELLLLGWAYAESIMDLRSLMAGGTLALVKTPENWQLGLTNIGNLAMEEGSRREEKGGLSYEGYLRLLLALERGKKKVVRAIDLIETTIRQTKGNENFRMDCCFSKCNYALSYEAEPLFLSLPLAENMLGGVPFPYCFSEEGTITY